jgi:hypothetical protein
MIKKITKNIAISSLLLAPLLSAEPYIITVPDTPKVQAKVPKVDYVKVNGNSPEDNAVYKREKKKAIIGSSHRVPPHYGQKELNETKDDTIIGGVKQNRLPAYLYGSLTSLTDTVTKLEDAGFNVLAKYETDRKGKYTSVVFTNDKLEKLSSKKSRGFASSLRLLVDTKNSKISILNPIYMTKAYMQDSFDEAVAKDILKSLHEVFPDLKPSKDIVKFTRLPHYQFMQNMPTYQDMLKVAIGKNEDLLKKARESKRVKLIYEQKLSNGSTIIGVELSRRTGKFVRKIGYHNSQLLPYPILIENDEAKILEPKYYIALMYPTLSMSEFMKIATVPGSIQKDCDRVFR